VQEWIAAVGKSPTGDTDRQTFVGELVEHVEHMRRAAAVSMRLICACATGERSTKACIIRGMITSSV
jgi:hypothetical protein